MESIPPHRPSVLSTFLGKLTRRISIDRWRRRTAENGAAARCPWSWRNCRNASNHLSEVVNSFVKKLPGTEQKVFLCRYWYMDSIGSISQQFGFSESKRKKENSQGSVGRGGDLGRLHMHRDDAAERDFE